MSKFKKGDKVRVKLKGHSLSGNHGIVFREAECGAWVMFANCEYDVLFLDHGLELVEDTSGTKPDPKSDPNEFDPEIKTIEIKVSINPSSPETEAIQAIAQIMDQYQDCNQHSVAAWFSTKYGK